MVIIKLTDANAGVTYRLQVSEEDAKKANEGKNVQLTYVNVQLKLC